MASSTNGEVTFQQGATLQLGGPGSYEFVRLDVSLTLPIAHNSNPEEAFAACVTFVEAKLAEQIREARGESAPKVSRKKKATKKKSSKKRRK